MKKMILLIAMMVVILPATATGYIWLHGPEGQQDAGTWDIYSKFYSEVNGKIYGYASSGSIKSIAAKLSKNMKNAGDTLNQVVVGHSMGGLIARSLQQITPGIKGIITAGSAHNGSVTIQNLLSGRILNHVASLIAGINHAYDASINITTVGDPPVSTLTNSIVVPLKLVKNILLIHTLSNLNEVFLNDVNSYSFTHQYVYDMLPNSTFLKEINGKKIDIPMINILGLEDNWQIIRVLGSIKHAKEVKNPANINKLFDMEFVQGLRSGMGMVSQIQHVHNNIYNALAIPAVFMPRIWITRELILKARHNWDRIYWEMETGMHAKLAVNMGAYGYKYQNYCLPSGYSLSNITCTSKYLPYITENDGILAASGSVLSGNVSNQTVYNIRLTGVNHLEMGNHPKMRKTFDDIIKMKIYGKAFAN